MFSRRTARHVLALSLSCAALCASRDVWAAVERYALLVGVNHGHARDVPLQYAESDVDAVAETLEAVGGYRSDRIVRLKNANATEVRNALMDLNLAMQRDVRAGGEGILFVYYSGHGSGGELHMNGTSLGTDEFSKLVRLSPAKLKLLMLDACRAGALTRVKGGRQVEPFQIGLSEELRNEGFAVITSSAAGEDAQESDALRSSVFSHHFLAALRGLGDANRDHLVTLGEAYAYAYTQSLRTSMTTVVGMQHATFDYDLRGRADPVLADLQQPSVQGELTFVDAGEYLLVPVGGPGPLVEAHVREPRTRLRLAAGTYTVRMRTPRRILEAEVALTSGSRVDLASDDMRPLPPALAVRKGEVAATLVHGPSVAGALHGPVAPGFSPTLGAQFGWALEFAHITLVPRLSFGRAEPLRVPDQVLSHRLTEFGFDLAALYVFDLGPVSVAPLAALGTTLFSQTVERTDGTRVARPLALVSSVGVWASWPLGLGVSLETSAELTAFFLRRQPDAQDLAPVASQPESGVPTYRLSLGLGYRY